MIVNNLVKDVGGKKLLNNVSFILNKGDKVALVGINGCGKSTLLKIIKGIIPYDDGSINFNNEDVSLLKQEIAIDDYNISVLDYVKRETNIKQTELKLHELENSLNDHTDEEYGSVLDSYLKLDGYNFNNNLSVILNGLNFNSSLDAPISILSGGQKIKVLLSIVLLSNAEIMLLDEPTNNLDIEAIEWLEDYLNKSDKSMIIVSHDEEFMSNIVNKVMELKDGCLSEYNMGYDAYVSFKDNEYNEAMIRHDNLVREKDKLKNQIQKAKEWSNKGISGKSKDNDKIAANFQKERTSKTAGKVSRLSKELDGLQGDDGFRSKEDINFFVDVSKEKGNLDIGGENLVCGYDTFKIIPLNFNIPFGSRVKIAGPNGSGKSTLIKTIIGDIKPVSGYVIKSSAIKVGYISQDSLDCVNIDATVYDYLNANNNIDKGFLFTILDKFHIRYDDKDKKYGTLSPGERTRVNLAKLASENVNVLILDEATNHLDLEAVHILESVIKTFSGTIISVSHNRTFNKLLNPDIEIDITNGLVNNKY